MEEILASIRRIIADDDASKTAKPAEPAAPKAPPVAAVPARPAPPPPRAPAPPPRPAPPAVANSQEDIDAMLADIEQNGGGSAPEVLDLTESMAASTPSPAASFRTIDGQSDVVFSDRAPAPPPPPQPEPAPRYEEPPRAATPMPDHGLLSNAATSAVDNAFNSLAHTVLAQNARTLDDIVREMLRPMLKAWLDDNLPGMVERIVRAEIERVSRGRP
jgi:cell pole-organizing protein PopZ